MLPALAVIAVVCFAAALALFLSGRVAPIAAAHVAFALGVLPLVLAAITHFVPVLTRSRPAGDRIERLPVATFAAGLLVVAAFVVPGFFGPGVVAGALAALMACVLLAGWIVRRAREAIGAPHTGLWWYLAAMACVIAAVLAVLAGLVRVDQRNALRVLHLHLNLVGFVGLAAVGTLQVLVPTAVGRADPRAAVRLRRDLVPFIAGVLLIAAGAAWAPPIAWAGLALLLAVLARLLWAWWRLFGPALIGPHGAAPSLALATVGLLALLAMGGGHAIGALAGLDAIPGFVLAFLLPLVTGALSQLLPLWLRPGVSTPWHHATRAMLGRGARLRAVAFVTAGLGVSLGWSPAAWLAAVALAVFLAQLAQVLLARRTRA